MLSIRPTLQAITGTGLTFFVHTYSSVHCSNPPTRLGLANHSPGFIIHMITRETVYFINIRQAYLVSPVYANRVSSRTVMFSSVPDEYLKEDILQELLGEDIVSNIWIPRHVAKLQGFVDERDGVAMKLENAEIKLIKDANTARRKALKKERVAEGEEFSSLRNEPKFRQDSTSTTTAGRWLDHKRRPTHRLTFLIGEKVDTIDWCKKELLRLIPETEALQHDHRAGNGRPYNAAFVEFKSLRDAQSAFQSVTHHQAARMSPRFTGVHPEEIIWSNLRIKWWERTIRQFLVVAFVVGLIVFWSIPVGAISLISNVENLKTIRWLRWLGFVDNLPKSLSGLITGLLPSILLSVVMILLPPILRCEFHCFSMHSETKTLNGGHYKLTMMSTRFNPAVTLLGIVANIGQWHTSWVAIRPTPKWSTHCRVLISGSS